MVDFGVMFRCQTPPEQLRAYVQQAEAAGFDEAWIVEDCFFAGGLSSTTAALSFTERIKVGVGIVPAVARNPAFTAMEFAAMARMFPGRFLPGIGHGVAGWMEQIGALPISQMAALEETTNVVKALMRGEKVTFHGKHVHLDDVQLEFPAKEVPPVQLGVRGPKSLALSGRCADGTVLCETNAPAYVRWAKKHIEEGQAQAGRSGEKHRLTLYVWADVDEDHHQVRASVRGAVAQVLPRPRVLPQVAPMGIREAVEDLIYQYGDDLAAHLPDPWLDELSVSGTVADCVASVERFIDTGVDSLVFVPPFDPKPGYLDRLSNMLLPALKAHGL